MPDIIDRAIMPEITNDFKFDLHKAEKIILPNGIPVYIIDKATQDVSKIELIFNAGSWQEKYPLQARMTNRMLREGAGGISGKKVAETMDFYGASLNQNVSGDYAIVTLMSLNKQHEHIFPLFEKIVKQPDFSDDELEIVVSNNIRKLKVNLKKNEVVADRKVHDVLFGENHPYGYNSSEKKYSSITTEWLKTFHKQTYRSSTCKIIVSGKVGKNVLSFIEKHFGGNDWKGNETIHKNNEAIKENPSLKHIIPVDKSMQSAIRLTKLLFNKAHPDYYGFHVMNTMLGGYFGSRLMSNIREDKGYTYGIYSGVYSYLNAGYWYVTTEAGIDVAEATVKEIYSEIERLQNELAPESELELVKNYLKGSWLSGIDGPFKLANLVRGLILYDLDYDYFYKLIETINNITAEDIRQLAQTHLKSDNLHEIIIG